MGKKTVKRKQLIGAFCTVSKGCLWLSWWEVGQQAGRYSARTVAKSFPPDSQAPERGTGPSIGF